MCLFLKYDGPYVPSLWPMLGGRQVDRHVWRFDAADNAALDQLMESLAAETNRETLKETLAVHCDQSEASLGLVPTLQLALPFNTLYARRLHAWMLGDLRPHVRMHFQPLVDMTQDGQVFALEALCRLEHPQGRLLSGAEAFHLAGQLGREADLDLECQFMALEAKANRIPAGTPLFLNVLPQNMLHSQWTQRMVEHLNRLGIDRREVVIEVVESERVDPNVLADSCEALRTLGFRIALDDMGAGFNGLSTLAAVRADFIKVDRSIVHGAQGSRVRSVLLEAIVSMAQRLGATVIAEGLERPEDVNFVRDMGISYAQGFYFAQPQLLTEPEVAPLPRQDDSCRSRPRDRFQLTDLMDPWQSIDLRASMPEARQIFQEAPSLPLAIVTDQGQPIGLVRRGKVLSAAARTLGKLCEPVARNLPHRLTTPALARILYHDRKDSDPWVVTSNEGQYLGVIHPMTLIAQMLARRENGSNLHPLSHLPTGPSLRHTLESRLAENQTVCLVYIDLDHFKAYNDRYGFIRGDAMIRTLAELLRHTFVGRPECLLGHIGGDDFILVMESMGPGLTDELLSIMEQFQALASHLYDHEDIARGHFLTDDGLAHPIASISVAVVNASTGRLANAVAAAERAAALKKVGKVEQGSVIVVEGVPPAMIKQQHNHGLGLWKENAIAALADFIGAPRSRDPHALDAWFRSYPFFEMVFELDGAGVQRYPNWINPDMYGRIKAGGVGVDRSEQPYFAHVAEGGQPYVSEIYLSSATEDFCITLAVPLREGSVIDGVLVADINISSMASLTRRFHLDHEAQAA